MARAKFNLRSRASNSQSLMTLAATDKTADTSEEFNNLGLRWNPATDTLSFVQRGILPPKAQPVTKCQALQDSSKIYDPLGLLSPVTIRAKIFMQTLWQNKLNWDEPLPKKLVESWAAIAKKIQEAAKIVILRRYFTSSVTTITSKELHVSSSLHPRRE